MGILLLEQEGHLAFQLVPDAIPNPLTENQQKQLSWFSGFSLVGFLTIIRHQNR